MSDAEKERIKYLATLFNTCAASCFSVGIVAPLAAAFYGAPTHAGWPLFVLATLSWLFAAFALDMGVRRILGRLQS